MQALSNRTLPTSNLQLTDTELTALIADGVPDRRQAAVIQSCLRSYRPVWELAHQQVVLDALLAKSGSGDSLWWRPARVALTAVAAVLGLEGTDKAEEWLFTEGEAELTGSGKNSAPDANRVGGLLAYPLVYDSCVAFFRYKQARPADWNSLPEGVLVALYDFTCRTSSESSNTAWLAGIARERPGVAAQVLVANYPDDESAGIARHIALTLLPAQALAFSAALQDLDAGICVEKVSAGLVEKLPETMSHSLGCGEECLAHSTMSHLFMGMAAVHADVDLALSELDQAWLNGREFTASIARNLGLAHLQRSDPMAALSSFQQGLQISPTNAGLRAEAAAALNVLSQHQEALDLIGVMPEEQIKADFDLVYQRGLASAALAGNGKVHNQNAASDAQRAAELADTPEKMVQAAGLYDEIGDRKTAINLVEKAIAQKPARVDWCRELGRLNAAEENWEVAEAYYTQALALEPENLESLLELVAVLRAESKMGQALEQAAYAANLQPQNPRALLEWVATAFQAGQWQTVVSAGKAALAVLPESSAVNVYVGKAFASLDQEEDALYYLSRAARLPSDPPDPSPWLAWVDYLESKNRSESIDEILEEGIQQLGERGAGELYCRKAGYYEKLGRPTEAQSTLMRGYQSGERSAKLLTHLGSVLNQLGHHSQAVKRLEEAVGQKDANEVTFHALALALESSGRKPEALAAARKAVQMGTDDPEILSDAGRLALEAGDFDGAADLLGKVTASRPESIQDWKLLGQAHQSAGKWEKSLEAYSSAVRLEPNDPHLQHQIGLVCTELGRYDTAIVALTEASRKLPEEEKVQSSLANALEAAGWWGKAAQIRSYIVQLAPKVLSNLINWARASRKADDLEEALDAIKQAEELAPGHPKVVLETGLYELAHGDRAGAVQSLTNLAQNCSDSSILIQTGDALMSLKERESGALAFSRAAAIDPGNAVAQARLGEVSARLGDLEKALAAYQAAARLAPERAENHVAAGQMHWQLKDAPNAIKAWERACVIEPERTVVREKLARAYRETGNPAAAITNYELAAKQAKLGKEAGESWREAGRMALELDQLDKAQHFIKLALEKNSYDPQAHSLTGILAERLGKKDEALVAYRKAARLAPAEREIQLQLADALADRGKELEALELWKKILDETGAGQESRVLLEKMAKLYANAGRFKEAEQALNAAMQYTDDPVQLERQLACVIIDKVEQADYWLRAGIDTLVDQDALSQASARLSKPETAQERRDLARAQLLMGKFDDAATQLEAYLAETAGLAGDLKAQRALGVAYRKAGKYDASVKALTSAIQLVSNDVQSLVELTQTYLESDQAATAASLLGWLMTQDQADPILLYHYAITSNKTGDSARAIQALQQAVDLRPDVISWQRLLSSWLRQDNCPAEAVERAQKAVDLAQNASNLEQARTRIELARGMKSMGRLHDSIVQWRAALKLAPENGSWWKELGKLLLDANQPESAIDSFAQASKVQEFEPDTEAELLLWWAQASLAMSDSNSARKLLDKALTLSPENHAVLAGYGHWQAAAGKWQDALASYQSALIKARKKSGVPAGERANLYYLIACAYHALGAPAQAIEELEQAAKIDSKNGAVFALLGEIYDELDNQDLARQAYQQAAQAAPTDPKFVRKLAQFLRSEGQLDQALDWLTKAIAAVPSAGLWLEAAGLYEKRGQRAKQMEALHHAVELEPENAQAMYELGLAFKQRKAYNQAIKAFETVTELQPRNQEAHKQLSAVIAMSLAGRIGKGKAKG